MNLEKYQLNDFLMDESFCNWVVGFNNNDEVFWETWLKDHPEKLNDVNEAKKILNAISFKDKSFSNKEIQLLWDQIKAETHSQKSKVTSIKGKARRIKIWDLLKVAAVLFPFVIASVLFLFYRDDVPEQSLIICELIEKQIPKGQKLTIYLPDRSKVILNSESKISYSKLFNEHQRIVELEGEAFFEVTPDKDRPFIVKSGNLLTKVLGTSFNIKAYPSDNNVKIAVKTGLVSVENTTQKTNNKLNTSVILQPSEMVVYNKSKNSTNISNFDPREELAWSEGVLYFKNASMKEFVAKIERWYGIDIIVKREKPIKKGIVGEFHNQSLEDILIGMHEASEFEYEFKAGKLIIR